jgi:hypothetical protein
MALTHVDRRRILLATALTFVALPALWWANKSDTSGPNVATAGLAVGAAAAPTTTDNAANDDAAPVFLDGPSAQVGAGLTEIAVPQPPAIPRITTTATFRSDLPDSTCRVVGVGGGVELTVVNLDNNRSITCTATLAPIGSTSQLVMSSAQFAQIADLTDAPIPVEIRQ